MKLLKFLILIVLLLLAHGCTEDKTTSQNDDAQPAQSTTPEPAKPAGPKVVPIAYTGEDLKKAEQAPDRMAFIKGGCFRMGNDYAQEDERPEHEVCVDDFYLSRYEVTQAGMGKGDGLQPLQISRTGPPCRAGQLLSTCRSTFRNPAEPAGCPPRRNGSTPAGGRADSRYYWGNLMEEAYAWYEDNSDKQTHPVGGKKPNQYGLHDMMGNVWEWIGDWYEPYYRKTPKDNPKGPETGEHKVIRGGAFDSSAGALRVTNRIWLHPKNRVFPKVTTYGQVINEIFNYIGFRCALSHSDLKAAPTEKPASEEKPATDTTEEQSTGT